VHISPVKAAERSHHRAGQPAQGPDPYAGRGR
jgi:hypothetical protein